MPASPATKRSRTADPEVRDVSRHIPAEISEVLWGRAAGRCEFRGCNDPLWKSGVTQEPVKIAERAHIYAFGRGGPRSKKGYRALGVHALDNLLLVCRNCHRTIDQHNDGGQYTAEVLQAMKREHEARVELVTGIVPSLRSQVLVYSTNVGEHQLLPSFHEAAAAMFPGRLPGSDRAIELGSRDSALRDHDAGYWQAEAAQLQAHFGRRVRERTTADQDRIEHLSVFAVAPQPLLVLLGSLLGELVPARIHQRRREPTSWTWGEGDELWELTIERPASTTGVPALVLGLSAEITSDRITGVLDADAAIWRVTVAEPHNDLLQTEAQLAQWRKTLRRLIVEIEAAHGHTTQLHVFPALPVAAAIEVGRVRMPKANMPWLVYDQNNQLGGFVPAISIS